MTSIIVPIYKAELYLRRCIQSIINQTYTDFELILVNDGSPDKSGIICDKYAKIDPRIKVIHKPNEGPSSSRNQGLSHASGEWIVFIDADDYVDPEYLATLHYCNPNNNIKLLVMEDNRHITIEGKETERKYSRYNNKLINIGEEQDYIVNNRLLHHFAIYGKLFSNEIIKTYKIKFNPKVKHCEDALFFHEYLLHIKQIYLSSSICYNYIIPSKEKYSISLNEHKSPEAIYELAKAYSELSNKLIERFHIEAYKNYSTEIMNMFINRYMQILLMKEFDDKPIKLPVLRYYHPQSPNNILFKYLTHYFPTNIYRLYEYLRTTIKMH